MKLTFLGTGTSVGVPMIGCDCPVCHSTDPRNRRRRSCLLVSTGALRVVVDTPPDFREQALGIGLRRLDAVLISHCHADHVMGFDDVRRFNTLQGDAVIPAYAVPETLAGMRRIFNYIDTAPIAGFYRPLVDFREIAGPFEIRTFDGAPGTLRATPLPVVHGTGAMTGFRLEADGASAAYISDCSAIPPETMDLLRDLDVMVLDALRPSRPHATHLTTESSLELLRKIGAKRSWMTHLCHEVDHATLSARLPPGIEPAYDGLEIDLG
ncbi:MAG: MBL fold metallo-hydrolase [Kiritimatiellia bacterium]|jgi:phosphoribosyl 1,2-cyclic phosphate phosphodiesterase